MSTFRIIIGVALVVVAVVAWTTGSQNVWLSLAFVLIGLGLVWRGLRGRREQRRADG